MGLFKSCAKSHVRDIQAQSLYLVAQDKKARCGLLQNKSSNDTYQVHKYRNYTLKGSGVLRQCNVKVLYEVLWWAGLEKTQ